jgi:hypothetical protein
MALVRSEPVFIEAGDDNQILHNSECIVNGFVISAIDGQARLQLWNASTVAGCNTTTQRLDLYVPASGAEILAGLPMGMTEGCVASLSNAGKVTIAVQKRG